MYTLYFGALIDIRLQILMCKVDPRTERMEIFIMAVDTQHIGIQMNKEVERAN